MAKTKSEMIETGTPAPYFRLPDADGKYFDFEQISGDIGTLVLFICNHCPFVVHVIEQLTAFSHEMMKRGVGVVAISANDIEKYPDDAPDKMKAFAEKYGFNFPYLYDESQETAKAYRAACTPDIYLFDEKSKLYYRGRFDGATPGNDVPVTGEDLRNAAEMLLAGKPVPEHQVASIGCNIKWKAGNEPDYFG